MQSRNMTSGTGSEIPEASGASRVGDDLRAARERLGWGLTACAKALRIRREYLVALEGGQFDAFPAPAYATGFLRSYGKALGLDADELVRRFKEEVAGGGAQTRLAFPVPAPERGWPTGAVVLLGALLAVGAYVGWYRLSGEGRLPAEVVPSVPARLAPLAEQAVPPSPARPSGHTIVVGDIPEPGEPIPPSTISPSSAAAAIPLPPVPGSVPPPTVVQTSSPASGLTTPVPPRSGLVAGDTQRLTLRAHGDAWVQVRERNGKVLLRKVLKAGETWSIPPTPGLLLSTGNAGNTEIVLDGTQLIALSGSGTARRDLPLDLDQIKDNMLGGPVVLPQLNPQPKSQPKPATGSDAAYVPPGSN